VDTLYKMAKLYALILIIALRVLDQPSHAQEGNHPFTSPLNTQAASAKPARFVQVNGSRRDQKVYLEWTVDENETADQFQVEKSTDGRKFSVAAFVFGTDRGNRDTYRFYENVGKEKLVYRIKLINKNKQTGYSAAIVITAA
jgi:hypothetical protein